MRSQLQTVLDPPPPLPDAGVWEDGAWIPVSEKSESRGQREKQSLLLVAEGEDGGERVVEEERQEEQEQEVKDEEEVKGETEVKEEEKQSPADDDDAADKPWQNVRRYWLAPRRGVGEAEKAAKAWAAAMNWPEGSVCGAVPVRLVSDLERLYTAAPMVAA